MSVDRVLDDLRDELAALFGAGLATPGPGRGAALRSLAETLSGAGAHQTSAELEVVADRLDAIVGGTGTPEELGELYQRIQRLTTWETQFRRAWMLRARREELAAAPSGVAPTRARPPGIEGAIIPLGITDIDGRVLIVARIAASGESLVLHDDWPGSRGPDPFHERQPSRLFQEPVVPATILGRQWHLDDHPAVRRRDRWVAGPSFFSRPRVLEEPVPREAMPETLSLAWSSDGFSLHREGDEAPVDIARDAVLDFNLRKWRVFGDTVDVRLAATGDRETVVAMADDDGRPCFPTVDPAAVRWSGERLREVADRVDHPGVRALVGQVTGDEPPLRSPTTFGEAVVAAHRGTLDDVDEDDVDVMLVRAARGLLSPEVARRLARDEMPSEPRAVDVVRRVLAFDDPAERQRFVQAHVTALVRGLRRGGVLPPGRDLWLLARVHEHYGTGHDAPLVDLARLRLAAVEPLSRALEGSRVSSDDLEDALVIVVGWEDAARFVK